MGSAWTGHLPGENPVSSANTLTIETNKSSDTYSAQLLELAKKQRMNTGVRKDIFCILMTAEVMLSIFVHLVWLGYCCNKRDLIIVYLQDYLDAFEKLLHLNLKNQQRQEIVSVLFDCCLQEKSFNPYYAHLSQKFCDFDRQYQVLSIFHLIFNPYPGQDCSLKFFVYISR